MVTDFPKNNVLTYLKNRNLKPLFFKEEIYPKLPNLRVIIAILGPENTLWFTFKKGVLKKVEHRGWCWPGEEFKIPNFKE